MAFPANFDLYKLNVAQASVPLASGAGAAISCAAFGTETWAVRLSTTGSASSTGGVKFLVVNNASDTAVTSLTGFHLVANYPEKFAVRPGQKISAISADAGTPTLYIAELTK